MIGLLSVFLSGLVFGLGLGVSGMTDANKVIGFLDVMGQWDPALAFVMVGAIGAHLATYKWVIGRPSPLYSNDFQIPSTSTIDKRLVTGAALFGVGWGLGGFCPGPGLVSTASLGSHALVFAATMLLGMVGFHAFDDRSTLNTERSAS